jgi:hypothetical protein
MTFREARQRAIQAGATDHDIDKAHLAVKRGAYGPRTIVNNMTKALQMHSWCNTAQDWVRLAGALKR